MAEINLKRGIVDLSQNKEWDIAKKEWQLKEIYFKEYGTCLCGHTPIKEICVLHNHLNNKDAIVGNCCVTKFMDTVSNTIFTSVKKVIADETKSLNKSTLKFAREKGWINERENNFYGNIFRKRSLSVKQIKWKVDINRRVLSKINSH